MSELGLVQKTIFSWAEPNSNWGRPKLLRLAQLIYALGHGRSKVEIPGRARREERLSRSRQIEIGVPNWFRRRTFHVPNLTHEVRLMKSLASEPGLTRRRITFSSSVIKDWNVNSPISHLAGGMKYKDGKLTVPSSGRYYIYAQIY